MTEGEQMNSFALTKQDTSVMKGIAICAMLLHHLYGCPPEGVLSYSGVLLWLGELGKVCVALFLFCSGYGLSVQYRPKSIKDDLKFLARRLVKFYANYWVIFIIFVPISLFVFHEPELAYNQEVWKDPICLLLDVFGLQNSYNVTWWFNATIIELYVLFPILYRLIRIKPWFALIIGMVLIRIESHLPFETIWLFPFIMGIVWHMYEATFQRISTWLTGHKVVFAVSSIFLLVLITILRMYSIIPHWSDVRLDAFVACSIALLVISLLNYMPHTMKVLSFFGKHSINIYLIHTFFNAYWFPQWFHNGEWMRWGGNFIVLTTICLLISIGIELLKEKIRLYKLVQNISDKI